MSKKEPKKVVPKVEPSLPPEGARLPTVDKSSVIVKNQSGTFVRSYSLAEHGKDFVEKAKGYAGKIGGTYEFPILL